MKVRELIEELESMPEDAEVRLAFQPSSPLQYVIDSVHEVELTREDQPCPACAGEGEVHVGTLEGDVGSDALDACVRCDGTGTVDTPTGETIVYISEGGQLSDAPYLPKAASESLGWR